jgi:hypothetical protein
MRNLLKRLGPTALVVAGMTASGCGVSSSWYTTEESVAGPAFRLDIEQPGRSFTVHACLDDDVYVQDLSMTIISRAKVGDPSPPDAPRFAMTVESPNRIEVPKFSEVVLSGTQMEKLVQSHYVGSADLTEACEDGFLVVMERLDDELGGRVDVEWSIYASAGSGSSGIEAGNLLLEVQ